MRSRRRREEENSEGQDRWMVSYADFVTLLFAFFVVMYATSEKDTDKEKKFEDSIKKAFVAIIQFQGKSEDDPLPEIGGDLSPIPPPIEVFKKKNATTGEVLSAIEREIEATVPKEQQGELGLELREDNFGVRITLDSQALFDSGAAFLKPSILPALKKISEVIKVTGRNLIIEGHTDSQPIKSAQFPSNWELAAARASTIVRYMDRVHQLDLKKMAAMSYADQRPLAPNDTAQGRAKNRRIEILITTKATVLD